MIGSRLLTEFDHAQKLVSIHLSEFVFTSNQFSLSHSAVDRLEGELMSELENGRLFRLLCKFGFINERPEYATASLPRCVQETNAKIRFDRDPRWSETGDRYILKLFRDYVFHQVDERGAPLLDLSHVLMCLNKVRYGPSAAVLVAHVWRTARCGGGGAHHACVARRADRHNTRDLPCHHTFQ